jgi:hypothetical protein
VSQAPYLSVVVTTRNDDHGGDPLQRFEAFVRSLVSQCKRFNLATELLVVEWNPPADRPRIVDALTWPEDLGPCTIKIIEVPHELHRGMRGAASLPLFQMIGKNVGIRRAKGEFILSTNIDIVFSHELFAFIASKQLDRHASYRVVRYDVAQGFPRDADADELLAFCENHQIRGQFPNGTFPLESDGTPGFFDDDIAKPSGGIRLGRGWHVREGQGTGQAFRWVGDRAELLISEATTEPRRLYLDLRPNPFSPATPVSLRVTDDHGAVLERFTVTVLGRHTVMIPAGPAKRSFWVELEDASGLDQVPLPAFESRDQLRYVAVGVGWDRSADPVAIADGGSGAPSAGPASLAGWTKVHDAEPLIERRESGLYLTTMAPQSSYNLVHPTLRATRDGVHTFALRYTALDGDVTFGPMQQDLLWWRPHQMRRTVDGDDLIATLTVELKEGDQVRLLIANHHPAGDYPSRVVLRDLTYGDGMEPLREADAPLAQRLQGALFKGVKALMPMKVKDLAKMGLSSAVLRMVEWQTGKSLAEKVYAEQQKEREADRLVWEKAVGEVVNTNEELRGQLQRLSSLEPLYQFLKRVHPASVHANACGDFLLLAREHWFELRGYAEFETYSMNVDGLFSYTAHYGGAPERRLERPLCIYHMEHAIGSGWTPEGEGKLRDRMKQGQVDWLDWQTVALWASFMRWLHRPMIFNPDNWGLSDTDLPEITLKSRP